MLTIATFDIETTNLNADFGIVLCGVVKPAYGRRKVFRGDDLNKKWKTERSDDSAVVQSLAEELAKHDVLIAHNGVKFDIPYLKTRLAKHKLPPFPQKKIVDPVWLARNNLRMSWNSLEKIASFLGVNKKTVVDGDMWSKASLNGCRESMDYIVEHCVKDVDTLEKVVDYLKTYSTSINSWGSGR